MAYLTQPDSVTYSCTCRKLKPITQLYFCKHCLKIRCGFCICHEVDSHYCSNCLENMPSSEARLKKNNCSSCFDCPSCFHTLSIRATTAQRATSEIPASPDIKASPKKQYYLSCFNCRWTSRDVGLPDQPIASGGWTERPNSNAARVGLLVEHFKALALREKAHRERGRFTHRSKYTTLTDKIGMTGAAARSIAGLPSNVGNTIATPDPASPGPTVLEINDLPDDIFTAPVNLKKVTNLAQRLRATWWQPTHVSGLHPCPRPLAVKRSQRCRECDHNLTKPEFNPGSIKFKIELLAYFHVPEIRLISWSRNGDGGGLTLVIRLTNPTIHDMSVTLQPDEKPDKIEGDYELARLTSECSVTVPARDDAAEYDEPPPDTTHPSYVVWRKSNKMGISLQLDYSGQSESKILCCLQAMYTYRAGLAPSTAPTQKDLIARAQLRLPTQDV